MRRSNFQEHLAVIVACALWFSGCSAGQREVLPPSPVVKAVLDYNGNIEYLPRTIESVSKGESALTVRYRYEVEQGREDGGDFFIPILNRMYIGRSGRWVVAIGQVELIEQGKEARNFTATREAGGSGLAGRSLTELRKAALLAVRDDLERQMVEASVTGTLTAH